MIEEQIQGSPSGNDFYLKWGDSRKNFDRMMKRKSGAYDGKD